VIHQAPGANCSNTTGIFNAYLPLMGTGYHYSGTNEIGKVVSPNTMAVYGTTGLYVLDASVFPLSPGVNIQLTTYAVAEKGIEMIIADRGWW